FTVEPKMNSGFADTSTAERRFHSTASQAARQRLLSLPGEPLFIADWERVLMIHYEVDEDALQSVVPFELDLNEGRAFVSLVAFTMRGMRPCIGGRLAALLMKPIATQRSVRYCGKLFTGRGKRMDGP